MQTDRSGAGVHVHTSVLCGNEQSHTACAAVSMRLREQIACSCVIFEYMQEYGCSSGLQKPHAELIESEQADCSMCHTVSCAHVVHTMSVWQARVSVVSVALLTLSVLTCQMTGARSLGRRRICCVKPSCCLRCADM